MRAPRGCLDTQGQPASPRRVSPPNAAGERGHATRIHPGNHPSSQIQPGKPRLCEPPAAQRWQGPGEELRSGARGGETRGAGRLRGSQQTSITWGPLRVQTDQGQGSAVAPPAKPDLVLGPCHSCTQGAQAGPGLGQCPPLRTLNPQQKAKERHSSAKSIYKHATSLPRPHLSRKQARGQGWAGPGGKPPVPRLSV